MNIWLDAQISPPLAAWITETIGIQALALRDLGLQNATDHEIFMAARQASTIVMTKDNDFPVLLDRYGTPPKIIWLTCGNTSNNRLKHILTSTLLQALALLEAGEKLIEISG